MKRSSLYLFVTLPNSHVTTFWQKYRLFISNSPISPSLLEKQNNSECTILIEWNTLIIIGNREIRGSRIILWQFLILKGFEFWVWLKNFDPCFVHSPDFLGELFCPFVLPDFMPNSMSFEEFNKKNEINMDEYINLFKQVNKQENNLSGVTIRNFIEENNDALYFFSLKLHGVDKEEIGALIKSMHNMIAYSGFLQIISEESIPRNMHKYGYWIRRIQDIEIHDLSKAAIVQSNFKIIEN